MTTEEVYRDYIKRFVLIIESAGEETKNTTYLDVENILSENEKMINKLIQDEAPFDVFISALIVILLIEIHDLDTLDKMGSDEVTKLAESLYSMYLKKPTKKFAAKYGIPIGDKLSCNVDVRKVLDEDE